MGIGKRDIKKIFSDELWTIDLSKLSKAKARAVTTVKLIRITFNTFSERKMGFQAVALSYFGALALIPMFAFIFSVTDGLGMADRVTELIYKYVTTVDPALLNMLLEKATNIINSAKSGIVGFVSGLMFLWTIIWLMFQVERVFNNVWNITKIPRKMYKRLSAYFGMLFLLPFVILIFAAGMLFYSNIFDIMDPDFSGVETIRSFIAWFLLYALVVFTLSAMFKGIPAAKVIYKNALLSAVICGAVFTGFQYLYLETQFMVARLNGVYGTIAAFPLFLIWMNISWQIILYGAEFTYALQHVDNYNLTD